MLSMKMFCHIGRNEIVMMSRIHHLERTLIQTFARRLHTHVQITPKMCKCRNKFHYLSTVFPRTISTGSIYLQKQQDPKELTKDSSSEKLLKEETGEEGISLLKRFHKAYKEHGKVLIGVHCVTSTVWFGIFYYAAVSGVDLVPLLQKLGAAEKIIEIAHSSVGNLATAYLMYKLATPARYTVTVFGTYSTVRYLKKLGYIHEPSESNSIRELVKDGRLQMKEKYGDLKGDVKEKLDDWKEDKLKKSDKKS